MVKNEEDNLPLTLKTLTSLDGIIMLDTGSTDSTIKLTRDWCTEHKLDFRLKEEPFVDFSTSRNVLLSFADETMGEEIVFLLLLDSSDQLKTPDEFHKLCDKYAENENDNAFYLTHQLEMNQIMSFVNVKLIKSHCDMRYEGAVHEFMNVKGRGIVMSKDVIIYQDRKREVARSMKRYQRDLEILIEENRKNPLDTRTIFYLAQTYQCLGNAKQSYKYNIIRSKMGGFQEEVYESLYRAARNLNSFSPNEWEKTHNLYMSAYHAFPGGRVEPLVDIAIHYEHKQLYSIAFMYLKMACQLEYPSHAILFVEDSYYNYLRWHHMGIVAYYSGDSEWKKWGLEATEKALSAEEGYIHKGINTQNRQFYL